MRQQRKSLWWRQLGLGLVLAWALELGLEQLLRLEQVLEQVLEQLWVQGPRRHRNQRLLWQGSSWHRASTGRWRSSMCRQRHCASCRRFERRLRLQVLLRQSTSPMY